MKAGLSSSLRYAHNLCASLHILLSLPFRVIFLRQSVPLPLFSISFFLFVWSCISWLLACLIPKANQSSTPIPSLTLYHSFPPRFGLFMLPYILSITLQQITHATPLCNFKLLINQSACVLPSLTLKRLKSTLHFISFAYTYSTVCTFVQQHKYLHAYVLLSQSFWKMSISKEGTNIKT